MYRNESSIDEKAVRKHIFGIRNRQKDLNSSELKISCLDQLTWCCTVDLELVWFKADWSSNSQDFCLLFTVVLSVAEPWLLEFVLWWFIESLVIKFSWEIESDMYLATPCLIWHLLRTSSDTPTSAAKLHYRNQL